MDSKNEAQAVSDGDAYAAVVDGQAVFASANRATVEAWVGQSGIEIRPLSLSAQPAVQVPQWISVKERLPEKKSFGKTYVWCYGPTIQGFNNVVLARFTGKDFFAAGEDDKLNPTHWMPLPPSPTPTATPSEGAGE